MPKFNLKSFLANLDTASQTITGKKLDVNLFRLYEVYRASTAPLNNEDTQDFDDCELLGVSPNATERIMKVALKAYQVDHHPDKLVDPTLKTEAEGKFKAAGEAFDRIKKRRNW